MLDLLHLFVLSVAPPFVDLLDDEHRSDDTRDDQQNIHRRILPDVREMNIYIQLAAGSVRPNTSIKHSNLREHQYQYQHQYGTIIIGINCTQNRAKTNALIIYTSPSHIS